MLARLPCSTSTIAALLRSDLYRHFLREEIDWIDNASLLANSCTLTSPRKCDVAIISRFSFHSILESPGCIQLLVNWCTDIFSRSGFLSGGFLLLPGNTHGRDESQLPSIHSYAISWATLDVSSRFSALSASLRSFALSGRFQREMKHKLMELGLISNCKALKIRRWYQNLTWRKVDWCERWHQSGAAGLKSKSSTFFSSQIAMKNWKWWTWNERETNVKQTWNERETWSRLLSAMP